MRLKNVRRRLDELERRECLDYCPDVKQGILLNQMVDGKFVFLFAVCNEELVCLLVSAVNIYSSICCNYVFSVVNIDTTGVFHSG